jgi:hypothetical protein
VHRRLLPPSPSSRARRGSEAICEAPLACEGGRGGVVSLDAAFGVDLRGLAALRFALAAITLVDLASRAPDLVAHYTDQGVLSADLARSVAPPGTWSVYFFATSPLAVGLGFLLHAAAAAAMLVGYRTRSATVLTWLLTASLHGRNPLVLQGADDLLRVLLFWSMLLPMGARWSVDARRFGAPRESWTTSLATAGLLVQVAAMYAATALQKTGVDWETGDAVWVAIAHDHFGRSWAKAHLLPHPALLGALGRSVLRVEELAPILLLCPVWARVWRSAAIVLLLVLQLGLGATLHVGPFPWVSSAALLPFVPSGVWKALEQRFVQGRERPHEERPALLAARARTVESAVAASALLFVVIWSSARGLYGADPTLPGVRAIGGASGLTATWSMFAPNPARDSGWFVMPGRRKGGEVVDLFPALTRFDRARPLTGEKPAVVFEAFPSLRWLDYMMDLTEEGRRDLWSGLAAWVCAGYRGAEGDSLESVEIVYVREEVEPSGSLGGTPIPPRRDVFYEGACP